MKAETKSSEHSTGQGWQWGHSLGFVLFFMFKMDSFIALSCGVFFNPKTMSCFAFHGSEEHWF